jgi:hypothetical protein
MQARELPVYTRQCALMTLMMTETGTVLEMQIQGEVWALHILVIQRQIGEQEP